jgi:hypothetical protein
MDITGSYGGSLGDKVIYPLRLSRLSANEYVDIILEIYNKKISESLPEWVFNFPIP